VTVKAFEMEIPAVDAMDLQMVFYLEFHCSLEMVKLLENLLDFLEAEE